MEYTYQNIILYLTKMEKYFWKLDLILSHILKISIKTDPSILYHYKAFVT